LQSPEATHPTAAALIQFALMRALPNPFSGSTVISYALPEASKVSLRVFNVLGQQVATLVSGTVDPGFHTMSWNARNHAGQPMPAGIYFYRLEATGLNTGTFHQQTRKMLMLK
jgi:flagellar hook assembly protein FlgD